MFFFPFPGLSNLLRIIVCVCLCLWRLSETIPADEMSLSFWCLVSCPLFGWLSSFEGVQFWAYFIPFFPLLASPFPSLSSLKRYFYPPNSFWVLIKSSIYVLSVLITSDLYPLSSFAVPRSLICKKFSFRCQYLTRCSSCEYFLPIMEHFPGSFVFNRYRTFQGYCQFVPFQVLPHVSCMLLFWSCRQHIVGFGNSWWV